MCIGGYYNEKFYIFDTFKCHAMGLEASNIINPDEVKKTILECSNGIFVGEKLVKKYCSLRKKENREQKRILREIFNVP